MGVKVRLTHMFVGEEQVRVFPHAASWYSDENRVLQIYQRHNDDPEFVVAEFNTDEWSSAEYDPPLAPPQPADGKNEGARLPGEDENGELED